VREQRIKQLEAPFELMRRISCKRIGRPELFILAHENATRCASSTPAKRVIEVFEEFMRSPMGRDDRNVFADILSAHPEMEKIKDAILERHIMEQHGDSWWWEIVMKEIVELAERKRAGKRV